MPPKSIVTDSQRKGLRDYARKNPNIRQSNLRLWFIKKYGIDVSQSFISVALSSKYRYLDPVSAQEKPRQKKPPRLKFPELEEALYRSILKSQLSSPFEAPEILKEAQRLWSEMFPEQEAPVFSTSWLERFRNRYNLSSLDYNVEAADPPATEKHPEVIAAIKRYSPVDVYTCAETFLYYMHTPDKKVDESSKNKMTIHVCCNSDGTVKAPPWYIGHPQNNQAFEGKDLSSLPYMFISNEKSCMTTSIFQEWLIAFDQHAVMGKRKVLLILESYSAHKIAVQALQEAKKLSNTEICFLPSGTSATTQAFNKGIIRIFKAHYRNRWLDYIWRESLSNRDFVSALDIIKVIDWCNYAWKEIPSRIIANCWNQTEISSSPAEKLSDPALYERLNYSISVLSGKGIIGSPIGTIDDFLLPSQECISEISGDSSENIIPRYAQPIPRILPPKSEVEAARTQPSHDNKLPRSFLHHLPLSRLPLQHSPLQQSSLSRRPFQHTPMQPPSISYPTIQRPPMQNPPLNHRALNQPPLSHSPLQPLQNPPIPNSASQNPTGQNPGLKHPPLVQRSSNSVSESSLRSPLLQSSPTLQRPSSHLPLQEATTPSTQMDASKKRKDSEPENQEHTKEPLFLRRGKTLIQLDGTISYMEQEGDASPELVQSLKKYRSVLIEEQGRDIRALSMGDSSILQSPVQPTHPTRTPSMSSESTL